MRICRVCCRIYILTIFMVCVSIGRAQAQAQVYPLDMQYDILFQENSNRFYPYSGSQEDLRRTWRILQELNQTAGVRVVLRTSRPLEDDTTQDRLSVVADQLEWRPDIKRHPRVQSNVLQPVVYFDSPHFDSPSRFECDGYILQIKNWTPFGDDQLNISPPPRIDLPPGVQARIVFRTRSYSSSEAFVTVPQAMSSSPQPPILTIKPDERPPAPADARATNNNPMSPNMEPLPPCETETHLPPR